MNRFVTPPLPLCDYFLSHHKMGLRATVSVLPFGVLCTHILLFCVSLLRIGVGLITISSFCGSVGKHELCLEDAITLPSSYDMIRGREGRGEGEPLPRLTKRLEIISILSFFR